MTRTVKLTDTHLLLLSAASQRDDHLLVPLANLKDRAASTATAKLLHRGLIEERMEDHHSEDSIHAIDERVHVHSFHRVKHSDTINACETSMRKLNRWTPHLVSMQTTTSVGTRRT